MDRTLLLVFSTSALIAGGVYLSANYTASLPPHLVSICTQSHNEKGLMPIATGKSILMIPTTRSVCDKYELKCKVGINYKGNKQCK